MAKFDFCSILACVPEIEVFSRPAIKRIFFNALAEIH